MYNDFSFSLLLVVFSIFSTIFFINMATKFPLLFGECKANKKSSIHHEKMIRGLGIVFPIVATPLFFIWEDYFFLKEFLLILSFSILGFVDDKKGINYKYKLFIFFVISSIYHFDNFDFTSYNNIIFVFSKIILLIFLVLFFNQIDGINGLAGSTFIVSILFLSFIYEKFIYILPVISIIFCYLFYNFRGKIGIQGDSGSYFLGSFFFIFIHKDSSSLNIFASIFFLCPILFDIMATTAIRLFYMIDIFEGHRNNLYQKLVSFYESHSLSTLIFIILQIIFSIITIFIQKTFLFFEFFQKMFLICLFCFLVFIFLAFLIQNKKIFHRHNVEKK